MKIERVITSVTANTDYSDFIGPSCLAWNKLYGISPTLAYIQTGDPETDGAYDSSLKELIESTGIQIHPVTVERIPEIEYGVQARATRMFMAASYEDTVNMVVDVDMIMLHKDFLGFADKIPNDHFVEFGYDHPSFQRNPDLGKWPMDKTTARGDVWKEIVNPDSLEYGDWVMSQTGFEQDYRTNIFTPFSVFCDESLLKCMLDRWGKSNVTRVRRDEVPCECQDKGLYGRLYEHEHPYTEGVDLSKFYEVHGPRPLNQNVDWYKPVMQYLSAL